MFFPAGAVGDQGDSQKTLHRNGGATQSFRKSWPKVSLWHPGESSWWKKPGCFFFLSGQTTLKHRLSFASIFSVWKHFIDEKSLMRSARSSCRRWPKVRIAGRGRREEFLQLKTKVKHHPSSTVIFMERRFPYHPRCSRGTLCEPLSLISETSSPQESAVPVLQWCMLTWNTSHICNRACLKWAQADLSTHSGDGNSPFPAQKDDQEWQLSTYSLQWQQAVSFFSRTDLPR